MLVLKAREYYQSLQSGSNTKNTSIDLQKIKRIFVTEHLQYLIQFTSKEVELCLHCLPKNSVTAKMILRESSYIVFLLFSMVPLHYLVVCHVNIV